MSRENYDVFISYRRSDAVNEARSINDRLRLRQIRCFYDFDELKDRKFDEKILDAIKDAEIFITILSPDYFCRCSEEDDWVRKEIECAIANNKKIVPINVNNHFDGKKHIPKNVPYNLSSGIIGHQFSEVYTGTTFNDNIDSIIRDRIQSEIPNIGTAPNNSVKIEISSDADCRVLKGGREISQVQANSYNFIYLGPGNHRLVFQSVKYEDIERKKIYRVMDEKLPYEDFIEVELLPLIEKQKEQRLIEEAVKRDRQRLAEEYAREAKRKEAERLEQERKSQGLFTANGVTFKMIAVQSGTYTMGATSEQGSDAWDDEKPAHKEKISDFLIGETPVTQELWQAVMGSNPSSFKGDMQRPVEQVSWNDCQKFIKKLNQLTGQNFRLPSEAEWEYAARGGNRSKGCKYAGSNDVDTVAWYNGNSNRTTHPVKTKQPNELGIYDMSGNVLERCQDKYYNSQRNSGYRVLRGGSWGDDAGGVRVSNRRRNAPGSRSSHIGLRLVL